jgi:PST family polysaccharide transporter
VNAGADLDPPEVLARALRSAAFLVTTAAFQLGVGLVTQVVLARLLSPETFGQIAFVQLVSGFIGTLRPLQPGEFLIGHRGDYRTALDTLFTADLAVSWLVVAVTAAAAGPIMRVAGEPDLAAPLRVAMLSSLLFPFAIAGVRFHREIDFVRPGWAHVVGTLVGPVVKIGLALAGFGVYSILAGEVVRQAVEAAVVWSIAPVRPGPGLAVAVLRDALSFSVPIAASSLLVYYYWKIDDLVVARVLGMEALGQYFLAFRIPEALYSLRFHLGPVVYASLARLDDDGARRHGFLALTRVTGAAVFPVVMLGIAYGGEILTGLFGPAWAPAVPPFKLLMLTCGLRMAAGHAGDLFKLSGRTWVFPLISVANAAMLTAGALVLTGRLGITGTAVAVLVTIAASILPVELLVQRWFGASPCRALRGPALALAAGTLFAALLRGGAALLSPASAAFQAALALAAYAAVIAVCDAEAVSQMRALVGSVRAATGPARPAGD